MREECCPSGSGALTGAVIEWQAAVMHGFALRRCHFATKSLFLRKIHQNTPFFLRKIDRIAPFFLRKIDRIAPFFIRKIDRIAPFFLRKIDQNLHFFLRKIDQIIYNSLPFKHITFRTCSGITTALKKGSVSLSLCGKNTPPRGAFSAGRR